MKLFKYAAPMLALTLLVFAGCATEETSSPEKKAAKEEAPTKPDTTHSGWWCVEHAIPEAECSMCSAAYAKECKEKGDWCEEHDRAKSQCFKCDPSLAEKYAKLYQAKYGKQPPAAIE